MVRIPPQDPHRVAVLNAPRAIGSGKPKTQQLVKIVLLQILQPLAQRDSNVATCDRTSPPPLLPPARPSTVCRG